MYRDNTLIPSEAIRLLALGILAGQPTTYAQLAREVRHFTGRIVGPSLDLVGAPLEVLKLEGLVASQDDDGDADDTPLVITKEGREEMLRLLSANVRAQVSDLNKLIIALKIRFLHLMDKEDQKVQAELLDDICERELARLTDLRQYSVAESGLLPEWLDLEIAQTRARHEWLAKLRERLN